VSGYPGPPLDPASILTDPAAKTLLNNAYAILQRPRTMASPATLAKAFRADRSAYNVSPTSLKRARAAAAAAFAGTGRLDICCAGTSVTAGTGAATKVQSWPSKLQAALVARGFPDGGSGLIVGQSNLGSMTDARVTLGTGWSAFSAGTSNLVQGTSASGSLTFTDTKPSTIIDVYYLDYFTFGFSWTIDGGAQTDVITTNATTLKKVTVSGLSSANHTVVITPKTGADGTHPVYIVGASFRNATGVAVHNIGIGGTTTSSMRQGQAYTPLNVAKFLAPQLTFWESGYNDGAPPLYAGYSADVQAAITGITGAGSDFVIIGEHPSGTGTRPDAQTLPVLYGLADTNDLALVDMNDRLISWASLDALGLGYDTDSLQVHLTAAGYGEYARTIDQALAF
jgi:lysophospholipase L1-like esterase